MKGKLSQLRYGLYLLVFMLLLFSIPSTVLAGVFEVVHDSWEDFISGTYDNTVDPNVSPGEILIRRTKNSLTHTTELDLGAGYVPQDSYSYAQVVNEQGGEISINQGYTYTLDTQASVANASIQYVFYDSDFDHLYACTFGGGVSVIDTKGTSSPLDDENVMTYTDTSSPSIGNLYPITVSKDENDLLYVSNSGSGGLTVIDTKGTPSAADDTQVFRYTTSSVPANIAKNQLSGTFRDERYNLLYVATGGSGLTVVDQNGTPGDASDDITRGTYTTATTPPISHNYVLSSWVDPLTEYLYVNVDAYDAIGGGLTVIDTKGTAAIGDDTLVMNYTTVSSPSIASNSPSDSYLDSSTGLLYVATTAGLSVIDTQKTLSPGDDTKVATYSTTSSPALLGDNIRGVVYDSSNSYIYLSTDKGLSVIDTNGTASQADDTIAGEYSSTTKPSINSDYVAKKVEIIDSIGIIVPNSGVSILTLGKYNSEGLFAGMPVSLNNLPSEILTWEETAPKGDNVAIQYRVGDNTAMFLDDFDDGDTSNISYAYSPDNDFDSVIESGGILTLSQPTGASSGYMLLDTGMPADYFPVGSIIRAKVRANSNATGFRARTTEHPGFAISINTNEWVITEGIAKNAFNSLSLSASWANGTWNNATDSFEVDWISVELPDSYWGSWTSWCSNSYGCEIDQSDVVGNDWVQWKLKLTSANGTTTPVVGSVSYAADYFDSGTYYSQIIDDGKTAIWKDIDVVSDEPISTVIDVFTRSGNSSSVNETWSDWAEANSPITSPQSRYLQYRLDFYTSNEDITPSADSVTVIYEDALSDTGESVVFCMYAALCLLSITLVFLRRQGLMNAKSRIVG
ncbi:MAG: hypothetical protein PHS44_01515 [Candidatus Dojkabacteria bacterium]|nr:hypothetical protein [Candidatus Dojkabacteria bacterium]